MKRIESRLKLDEIKLNEQEKTAIDNDDQNDRKCRLRFLRLKGLETSV